MHRKTLYLVDGNSYSYRAYYAMGGLSNSRGRPTGAVYGFVTMLNKLRADRSPDYLAVCFDLKQATFRHERYAEYKIHRKPMPDDLVGQMATIKELVAAHGIALFELAGFEADDIIATLAVRLKNQVDVFIVSPDKDMLQLVDQYVKIYNPQHDPAVMDAAGVVLRHNVNPEQIPDLIALAGDNSDNIPGVPGIGPKTAAELIQQFASLENLLNQTHTVTQKRRKELLETYADQARLSKELAQVKTDVPLAIRLEDLAMQPADFGHLRQVFSELEFRYLLRALPPETDDTAAQASACVVSDVNELRQRAPGFAEAEVLVLNLVATEPELILQITDAHDCAATVNVSRLAADADIARILREMLSGGTKLKVGYDLKLISVALRRAGVSLAGPFFDVMIAGYLLEPSAGTRGLGEIVSQFAGKAVTPSQRSLVVGELRLTLERLLKEKDLAPLFFQIEMPLVPVLARMEAIGIRVDPEALQRLDREITVRLEQLTSRIYEISATTFNINSPQQLADVLFNKLGLPVIKKGKSGPSTDSEVLHQLAASHELPAVVMEYRELAKLQSTFVQGLLALVDPETSRVHTSFNQAVTATGRLSSSNPNLQNIPVRTETGRHIRAAFTCREDGWQLLSADYSQIELRVLAHLSGDEQLVHAFTQGRDIHTFTASLIFGVALEQVDRRQRDVAKRVNFGIMYGMGPQGLARDLGVPFAEAKRFIDEYFQRYPGVQAFMQQQIENCRKNGYVTTLFNRRRDVPELREHNPGRRAFAERVIMNTPIQGTAADMIKAAMVAIDQRVTAQQLRCQMLLQVHDELVFDVPDEEIALVSDLVTQCMEQVVTLRVPVTVSVKVGPNWRDMKGYHKGRGT